MIIAITRHTQRIIYELFIQTTRDNRRFNLKKLLKSAYMASYDDISLTAPLSLNGPSIASTSLIDTIRFSGLHLDWA
jgi:hypothetical protein